MQAKAVSLSTTAPHTHDGYGNAMALTLLILQASMALAKPESSRWPRKPPSVVNITTSTTVEGRTGPQGIVPEGSPFETSFASFRTATMVRQWPRRSSALARVS